MFPTTFSRLQQQESSDFPLSEGVYEYYEMTSGERAGGRVGDGDYDLPVRSFENDSHVYNELATELIEN